MPAPDIVTTAPSLAFCVAMTAYIAGAVFHLSSLATVPPWVRHAARWTMILGFVAHGVDIGWRGVEHVHPGTSVREALGFLSWVLVGAYLVLSRRPGMQVLGSFVAPLACVVLAAARLSPSGDAVIGLSSLGRIHIASATVGLAIFLLATLVSLIYLLQERNLKKKKFDGLLFKSSAALETLDRISARLVSVGFPIFSLSMILGAFWASQRPAGFGRIEYPIAAITWVAFGSLVIGRVSRGLAGRRAAQTTILGFGAALLVLMIYFLRRLVGG